MDVSKMITKMINLLSSLIILVQIAACQSSDQQLKDCNRTINTRLELTSPYSDWVQVLCTQEGQIIKPAKGYQWHSNVKDNIYINKIGVIETPNIDSDYQNGMKIQISYAEKERIDYVIKNFNDFLLELKPNAPSYDEVYSLGFRGDMPFTYDFFILAKDSHPEYMILCKAQCHMGEPALIEVRKLESQGANID